MGMFGISGFLLSYSGQYFFFTLIHGGIAIMVYLRFYLAIFGRDSVLWMFLAAITGIAQIKNTLSFVGGIVVSDWGFEKYPLYFHIIPGLYVVLYTFLLRQFCIDLLGARINGNRLKYANSAFIIIELITFLLLFFL